MSSLWGDDFQVEDTKKLLTKINSAKEVKIETAIKSKKLSLKEKMDLIAENVNRILGIYKNNTIVINSEEKLIAYINAAIKNGVIAIDTETNRSLDPLTCKLVGFCIYTPGQKNAYVPINHIDENGHRLEWQCTEKSVANALRKVDNIKTIYHNWKFDNEVLLCTTGFKPSLYWDTLTGSQLLNENEKASLKVQYITHIDPSIEKYSIEHLFCGIDYELFDPELFALYAATDSYMTYRLYEYQLEQFMKPENSRLFNLFKTVEIPILNVASEMEMTGVCIDKDYAERLSKKYHKKLEELDKKVNEEIKSIQPKINEWSLTKDATEHPIKNGKIQKSKLEQLETPINLSSPTQMAILFYDILKSPVIDTEHPRSTSEGTIEQMNFPIVKLLLERRSLNVLINTFIDKIPNSVSTVDGRLHGNFNPLGREQNNVVTGRFSSSDPNLQNIPSGESSVRLMFKATDNEIEKISFDNCVKVFYTYDVKLKNNNWVEAKDVKNGDILDSGDIVKFTKKEENYVFIYV